jgi:hypothetical protein
MVSRYIFPFGNVRTDHLSQGHLSENTEKWEGVVTGEVRRNDIYFRYQCWFNSRQELDTKCPLCSWCKTHRDEINIILVKCIFLISVKITTSVKFVFKK